MDDLAMQLRDSDPARPARRSDDDPDALATAARRFVERVPARRRPKRTAIGAGVLSIALLGAGAGVAVASGALEAVFGTVHGAAPVVTAQPVPVADSGTDCAIGVWLVPLDDATNDADADGTPDSASIMIPVDAVSIVGGDAPADVIGGRVLADFHDFGTGLGEPFDQEHYDAFATWLQAQDWDDDVTAVAAEGDPASMASRMLDRIGEQMEHDAIETHGSAIVYASAACGDHE